MAYGSIIVKRVEIKEFLDTIKEYSREEIECTNHTFFRLSDQQKKIYTPEKLKEIILFETPILDPYFSRNPGKPKLRGIL